MYDLTTIKEFLKTIQKDPGMAECIKRIVRC